MAFDFPGSPIVGQTYTSGGITYTWNGQAWTGGPIADSSGFQPKDANLTALAGLSDTALGFPNFDGAGGVGVEPKATIAEIRGGTATPRVLGNKTVWDAAAPVAVTYAASIALDMATFLNAEIILTGALTLANPTNLILGRSGAIRLNAAAAQTLAFGTNWWFPPGLKPASIDIGNSILFYYISNTNTLNCSFVGPYSNA